MPAISWKTQQLDWLPSSGTGPGNTCILDAAAELVLHFSDGSLTAHPLPWSRDYRAGAACATPQACYMARAWHAWL